LLLDRGDKTWMDANDVVVGLFFWILTLVLFSYTGVSDDSIFHQVKTVRDVYEKLLVVVNG
jgi:hypothetical protein